MSVFSPMTQTGTINMTIDQHCECQSWSCDLQVAIPFEDAMEIKGRRSVVIIVDGCKHRAEPTDTLLEVRDGYSLYREI